MDEEPLFKDQFSQVGIRPLRHLDLRKHRVSSSYPNPAPFTPSDLNDSVGIQFKPQQQQQPQPQFDESYLAAMPLYLQEELIAEANVSQIINNE